MTDDPVFDPAPAGAEGVLAAARSRAEAMRAHAVDGDSDVIAAAISASDPAAREPSPAVREQMERFAVAAGAQVRVIQRLVVTDGKTTAHWIAEEHVPVPEELVQFSLSESVIAADQVSTATEIVLAAKVT